MHAFWAIPYMYTNISTNVAERARTNLPNRLQDTRMSFQQVTLFKCVLHHQVDSDVVSAELIHCQPLKYQQLYHCEQPQTRRAAFSSVAEQHQSIAFVPSGYISHEVASKGPVTLHQHKT